LFKFPNASLSLKLKYATLRVASTIWTRGDFTSILFFRGCLSPPNASGSPRSAEVGGKAAKNSISYMKTEAALIYAKADENCGLP
jgi:hypothetical protein